MAYVSHPRKHDINSDTDHIKNNLDLNGNLSLLPGNYINFNAGGTSPYTLYWNAANMRFYMSHTLELGGSLLMEGESTIRGGTLANDSLTLYPSRVSNTPAFTFEGQSYAGFIVDPNKTEQIWIKDNAYTPTTFFSFNHSADTSTTTHKFYIGTNAGETDIYLNGYIDQVITHNFYCGDNSSDYIYIGADGTINLYGKARQTRQITHTAEQLPGNSATYNGVSCSAAGDSVINDFYAAKTLNGGTGWSGGAEAFITTFTLPDDYDNTEGITLTIGYTSDTTSGSAFIGMGVTVGSSTYNASPTYQTKTIPAPSTAYNRATYQYDFSPTIARGDELGVVVYRDPDNSADDMAGDAMITSITLEYTANRIGGSPI